MWKTKEPEAECEVGKQIRKILTLKLKKIIQDSSNFLACSSTKLIDYLNEMKRKNYHDKDEAARMTDLLKMLERVFRSQEEDINSLFETTKRDLFANRDAKRVLGELEKSLNEHVSKFQEDLRKLNEEIRIAGFECPSVDYAIQQHKKTALLVVSGVAMALGLGVMVGVTGFVYFEVVALAAGPIGWFVAGCVALIAGVGGLVYGLTSQKTEAMQALARSLDGEKVRMNASVISIKRNYDEFVRKAEQISKSILSEEEMEYANQAIRMLSEM